MIGHLYTLLFAGASSAAAAPSEIGGGNGLPAKRVKAEDEDPSQWYLNRKAREDEHEMFEAETVGIIAALFGFGALQ